MIPPFPLLSAQKHASITPQKHLDSPHGSLADCKKSAFKTQHRLKKCCDNPLCGLSSSDGLQNQAFLWAYAEAKYFCGSTQPSTSY